MKYSDNKHLCHLTVASCKPLALTCDLKSKYEDSK